jgi:hypothetical protein
MQLEKVVLLLFKGQTFRRTAPSPQDLASYLMPSCARCGTAYVNFSQHVRQHPECDPALVIKAPPVQEPLLCATVSDITTSEELMQDEVARDLMDMRYKWGLSEPDIELLKPAVRRWLMGAVTVQALQLMERGYVGPRVTLEGLKSALTVDIFDGIETKKQEMAAAKRDLPYVPPRIVHPDGDGKGEPIVSFDMSELYFRRLRHDAVFRKKFIAKSDELKRGEKYQQLPEELDDILDGAVARWHPHIHRPATEEEADDVRGVQLEQVDDLELCNTLGVARGLHKQCGCQVASLNLPAEERFAPDNIMLPVLSRASVYKKHGMVRVLAGVDSSGKQHDEPCHTKDMEALEKGVWGTIPDDERGGMRWIRLKVYTLTVSADDPAKKSLTPFVESCSAHRNCNVCSFHAAACAAGRPLSFLCAPQKCPPCSPDEPSAKHACHDRDAAPKLREATELHNLLNSLRGTTDAAAITRAYKDHGINKLYYALEYYPHVKLLELPWDVLHLFPDGLLRSEGAWLFYVLAKLGLDLRQVDARVRAYRDLPRDVRIPPLHSKLKSGTKRGCPKSSAVLRMTGSQVMHFALHRYACLSVLASLRLPLASCLSPPALLTSRFPLASRLAPSQLPS